MASRSRNGKYTKPNPNSNQAFLGRHRNNRDAMSKQGVQEAKRKRYYLHYYNQIRQIAYQLFDWDGLPTDIPKNILEIRLHEKGHVGVFCSPEYGNIVVNGTGQLIGNYNYPTQFHSSDYYYQSLDFPIYYYGREKTIIRNQGLIVQNRLTDFGFQGHESGMMSSAEGFHLYATQLAEIKMISDVNLNTQKTPIVMLYDGDNMSDVERMYDGYDGNVPVMFTRKTVNENGKKDSEQMQDLFGTIDTHAPYIVDKLETQKQKIWDECMGWLGLTNMAQYKKERMTKSESEANMQQSSAMLNALLKPRLEFCELANQLYGWNIDVKPSELVFETEGGENYAVSQATNTRSNDFGSR